MKLVKIFLLVFATVQCQLNSEYSNNQNKRQVGSIRDSEEVSSIVSNTINPNLISVNSSAQSSTGSISDSEDASSTRSFSNDTLIRIKRASQEDFSLMVDDLSVSARLITAISLQNGLIDQSIPADKALAELLNIGSVDMEQLETFDKTKVDGFVTKLLSLGTTITSSSILGDVEKTLKLMADWTDRYSTLGDVKNKAPVETYFNAIDLLKSEKIDSLFLADMLQPAKEAVDYLKKCKELPDNTDTVTNNNGRYISLLQDLRSRLETLEAPLGSFTTLAQGLAKFQSIAENDFPHASPQRQLVNLFDEYSKTNLVELTTNRRQIVSSSLSAMNELSTELTHELESIKGIVLTRHSTMSSRNFTSGFFNGHSDLNKLAADVQNPSFSALVDGYNVKPLGAALGPLELLETELNAVDKTWSSLTGVRQVEFVRKVADLHGRIRRMKETPTTADATFNALSPCIEQRPVGVHTLAEKNAKIFNSASQLLDVVRDLPKIDANLISNLAVVSKLNDVIILESGIQEQVQQLPRVIKSLKTFPRLEDVYSALQQLPTLIEKITKVLANRSLPTMATEVANGRTIVESMLTNPKVDVFIEFLMCAKDLTTQSHSIAASISLVRDAFSLDPRSTQPMSDLASSIESSIPAVKKLRVVPAAIRANKDELMVELVKLKDLGKESKIFGESVKALDDVKKVLEKKTDVEKFMKDGENVKTEIQKLTDQKQKNELFDYWGDFEKTKSELTDLFAELESRRDMITAIGTRRRRATRGFSSYQAVFSAFIGLKSVDLEAEKRLAVLSALNQTTLLTSLTSLRSLNLNFAGTNGPLSEISSTLKKIDTIFSSAVARASTPKDAKTEEQTTSRFLRTSSPAPPVPLKTTPRKINQKPVPYGVEGWFLMWIGVTSAVLLVIVVIGTLVYFRIFKD